MDDALGIGAAYEACERLARQHYENFPVASLLLPARMRRHVAAVYAFARTADDFADEPGRTASERQRLLEDWLSRLHQAASWAESGNPREGESAGSRNPPPLLRPARTGLPVDVALFDDAREAPGTGRGAQVRPSGPPDADLLFVALGTTMRQCRLPAKLFEELLSAFRQDTVKTRYSSFDDVLDYCRRSANPVGRIVLRIAGYDDERMDLASDSVCTALQLVNFWQDLARDWRTGRLYVPLDEVRAAGAREEDLDAGRLTAEWQNVMSALGARTRELFLRGRPIADMVTGRLSLELRLTWLGGWRILERLAQQRFDVFGGRPTLRKSDVPALVCRAIVWRARYNR
jgi:squalene synthase HpnC